LAAFQGGGAKRACGRGRHFDRMPAGAARRGAAFFDAHLWPAQRISLLRDARAIGVDAHPRRISAHHAAEQVVQAVRRDDPDGIVRAQRDADAGRVFGPGRDRVLERGQGRDRMTEVPLEPVVHCGLVRHLPRHVGHGRRQARLQRRVVLRREPGAVDVRDIDVGQRGRRRVPVQRIPDEVAHRARADAPGAQLQRAHGAQRTGEPGRARRQGGQAPLEFVAGRPAFVHGVGHRDPGWPAARRCGPRQDSRRAGSRPLNPGIGS